MKTNVIYACKYKLVGIDSILPLLMEIRNRFKKVEIRILFPDEYHFHEIRKNYHIWKALLGIDAKFYTLRCGKTDQSILSLLKIFGTMLCRRNVLLKNSDVIPKHAWFMSLVKRLSKTTEIFVFMKGQTLEAYRLFGIGHRLSAQLTNAEPSGLETKYDYIISCIDRELLSETLGMEVKEDRVVRIGYHRRLQEWTAYMEKEAEELRARHGEYLVYYLTGISGSRLGLNEPEYYELLEESLLVLKKYSPHIKTVFKPHIITAMDEFEEVLERTEFEHYAIDYAHPMILARHARFAMAYTFSTVLFDAYYIGVPVVLYTQYDPRLLQLLGGRSEGGDACDFFIHRDPGRLDSVLGELMDKRVKVRRDPQFIAENFPETSSAFWDFWRDLLREV